MGHKLSILPRQYDKTGWHQVRQFNVPEIQTVKVDGSGKSRSLNSIPSPFARMHLFETAFEMVFQDLINQTDLAGETYRKIVSDCFDVFELLYNWDSHVREEKQLEMVTWKRDQEIQELKRSPNRQHKILGESFDTFLKGEPAFKGFDKCLIIKYGGKVIAGSSPFTGFFTTPDELSALGLLKPLSQVAYFSRSIPFELRNAELKKYILDFFENNDLLKGNSNTAAIRAFLDWHKNQGNIAENSKLVLKPVVAEGTHINVFGKNIETAKSIGTHFFEPQIVRLNYRINSDCFYLPRLLNDNRSFDYLLPLTPSFYKEFEINTIKEIVSIIEEEPGTVKVTININGKEISKKYQSKQIHDQDGAIIDLYNDHQININLGIFPFLKMVEQPEEVDYNDFYRVMFTVQDLYFKYSNKDFVLKFGKDKEIFEDGSVYHINRTDRTILESDRSHVGSIFYGLNTPFDFIQIVLPISYNGKKVKCSLAPKWRERRLGKKQIDFAIDFGTTSTFIAYTEDPNHTTEPRPFELNEKEYPVALLNRPKEKRPEFRWIDCFEQSLNEFLYSIAIQTQEFVPSIIKRNEKYQFPIRTVLFQQKSMPPNKKDLLSNSNISFVYQKADVATLTTDSQEFVTNLKWNIKTDANFENSIRVFIEELFILIRTKTLLNEGDPGKSKVYWFAPLSFTPASKRAYTSLWNTYSKKFLKPKDGNIYNLTESEAPFYYLFKNSRINNAKVVLTLDIGGGSTDIMVFNENKPVIGSSVHFGANVIWGNGFNAFTSDKSNGIYLTIKQEISEKLGSTALKTLNEQYCSNENLNSGSDEIINFWLGNNDETKVEDRLNSGDFRLSYLLHLCALIHHSLKLIKANGQESPTCIIFSGNGSKYVDLIHDSKCIEKIWGYFSRKIFDEGSKDPQVILPVNNRKEATCFGGLFVPEPSIKFKTENYLGFEKGSERYSTYKEIEEQKEQVFSNLLTSNKQFINCFFEMNDLRELNFKDQFGIEGRLAAIKKFLLEKASENLNEGYIKRLELVDKDDLISDSLFFYPLVGLIYKLNKLTDEDIYNLTDRATLYAGIPNGENCFLSSKVSQVKRPDSIYTITIENGNAEAGVLNIIDDPQVHKMALGIYQGSLNPACTYTVFPEPGKLIKVINTGRVKKTGDIWVVVDKIQIEFV